MPKKPEVIARLIIIQQGHVLLSHKIGANNTYLTGGHIERDETAHQALAREFGEECGCEIEVGDFVGVVEHAYTKEAKQKRHHEYNLVFTGKLPDSPFPQPPQSKEPDLEFLWQPLDRLDEANLLPQPMREIVQKCAAGNSRPACGNRPCKLRGGMSHAKAQRRQVFKFSPAVFLIPL